MTSDIGKHPKRRKKENINVTSGEMIDLGTFYLYTVRFWYVFQFFNLSFLRSSKTANTKTI